MAITKSAKIEAEIEKVKAKIAEQQARLKELEQKKLEAENSEIVEIVRGMSMMTKTASGSMNGGITAATVPLWNRTLRRGYRNTSAFTTSASSRPRLPAFTSITPPSAPWTLGHSRSRPTTLRMRSSTTISASRLKMDRFWRGGI